MKNFQVTSVEDGGKYWISRSIAVCAILLIRGISGDSWFLLQRRGPDCPDFVGCWSHTCGYLDYDESIVEALKRELYEELGIKLPETVKIIPYGINDKDGGRQNVTHRFIIELPEIHLGKIDLDSESRGGEASEVTGIMKLSAEPYSIGGIDFAFNHKDLTKDILEDPRFFPGPQERKLYEILPNALQFTGYLGVTRVQWIITKTIYKRVHVTCDALGIDEFWDCLQESIKDLILDKIAYDKALEESEKLPEEIQVTPEIKIKKEKYLEMLLDNSMIPGTSERILDKFRPI